LRMVFTRRVIPRGFPKLFSFILIPIAVKMLDLRRQADSDQPLIP